MKKSMILGATLCAAFMLSSCGASKESAYKKAYEKAKAQEQGQSSDDMQGAAPVVTPLEESPATQVTTAEAVENATVRQESVTVVSGSGLSDYSVVVGSFSLRSNAEGLYNRLKSEGNNAQLVFNAERGMYRVVAATFVSKADAVASRNQFRSTYPDAWLLYRK